MKFTNDIPWPEIKQRWLLGESPKKLSIEYGLRPNAVSDKATKNKWGVARRRVYQHVEKTVMDKLEKSAETYLDLIAVFGKDLLDARASGLIGLTTQDGEGFSNKYVEQIIKAGLSSVLERQRQKHRKEIVEMTKAAQEDEGEAAGFNVTMETDVT